MTIILWDLFLVDLLKTRMILCAVFPPDATGYAQNLPLKLKFQLYV